MVRLLAEVSAYKALLYLRIGAVKETLEMSKKCIELSHYVDLAEAPRTLMALCITAYVSFILGNLQMTQRCLQLAFRVSPIRPFSKRILENIAKVADIRFNGYDGPDQPQVTDDEKQDEDQLRRQKHQQQAPIQKSMQSIIDVATHPYLEEFMHQRERLKQDSDHTNVPRYYLQSQVQQQQAQKFGSNSPFLDYANHSPSLPSAYSQNHYAMDIQQGYFNLPSVLQSQVPFRENSVPQNYMHGYGHQTSDHTTLHEYHTDQVPPWPSGPPPPFQNGENSHCVHSPYPHPTFTPHTTRPHSQSPPIVHHSPSHTTQPPQPLHTHPQPQPLHAHPPQPNDFRYNGDGVHFQPHTWYSDYNFVDVNNWASSNLQQTAKE